MSPSTVPRWRALLSHLLLAGLGALMLAPFGWMLLTSLKREGEVFQRHLLPRRLSLGDEGTAVRLADGTPLLRTDGRPLTVSVGCPARRGGKGDRARLADGSALSDDLGLPLLGGDLMEDAGTLAALGGVVRLRDGRLKARWAEPLALPPGFAAPGFDPAANLAAARRWFCGHPGRYREEDWDNLRRERWGGGTPLMLTPALAEAWAPLSGKAEPARIGPVPLPNPHPRAASPLCSYLQLTWTLPGEPVRDKTLPAAVCDDGGAPLRWRSADPLLAGPDDPLLGGDGRPLTLLTSPDSVPRTVFGRELALEDVISPAWSNYATVLSDPAFKVSLFAWNSLFCALCITALQVLTCSLAAYAFARLRFPGRDALFLCYLASLALPWVVTMVPSYAILQHLGWLDTFAAIIIPSASGAWGTFLMRQFFLSLPRELEEAAWMDGAGPLRTWWLIAMPLARPAVATLAIFSFVGAWSAFTWPLVVAPAEEVRLLPVALRAFSAQQSTNWSLLMAASTLMMLPLAVVFAIGQRHFVRGLQVGAVKG